MPRLLVLGRAAVLALLLLCLITPAYTAIIRVSPIGDDNNDGSTWTLAKRTLTGDPDGALTTAAEGDEIWVAAGVYFERITLKNNVAIYGGFFGNEETRDSRNPALNPTILDGSQGGSVVTVTSGITSTAILDGFVIRGGSATNGGGIYCSQASPTITGNIITGNSATGNGGGFYFNNCSTVKPVISGNFIAANTAASGGGIGCYLSSPDIISNTIVGNKATSTGGGIACSWDSNPTVMQCRIAGNGAPNGGGIYCSFSGPQLKSSIIAANVATVSGGGLYCDRSAPKVINMTIASNIAATGGGIYIYNTSSPTVANTIVAFNSSGIYRVGGSPVLMYNCVYGNTAYNYSGITAGTGDISVDPNFASLAYGNFHLQNGSLCIDTGTDDASIVLPEFDMDLQARSLGDQVDIGADESNGTVWPDGPSIVVRVSTDGNDANDGSSWSLAKAGVQSALMEACLQGGEVWIEAGVYPQQVTLWPYTFLCGGFAGTETSRDERDWVLNPTILDGQQQGSVVTIHSGKSGSISGLTIRNGTGYQSGANYYGGGIYCSYSSPDVMYNRIEDNAAANSGGGIYCENSSPLIVSNIIAVNTTTNGGGIYISGGTPTVTNNTFTANTTSGNGGGIYSNDAITSVSNNIIASNSSGIYKSGGAMTLRNNCLWNPLGANYTGITAGTGDIIKDPIFADATGRDFHLTSESPCIDAGFDTVVQVGWLDMDGQSRISRMHVDIGADETMLVATPTFIPAGGEYYAPFTVTISCATPGVEIHYTTDGSIPDAGSPLYVDGVPIDRNTTLMARAFKPSYMPSAVKGANYNLRTATPAFNPDGGTYSSMQTVTITCATPDAVIRYTTNGETPTEASAIYTAPIHITSSLTLKAKAWKTDWLTSLEKSADYTISMSLAQIKQLGDDLPVACGGAIVSMEFTDYFYIEDPHRICGIRVDKAGHTFIEGQIVTVSGTIDTNGDGERFIFADTVESSTSGSIKPVAFNNRSVGGGDWMYDSGSGAGQKGVTDSAGLNNIGLLARVYGHVTQFDTGGTYFYIDDGSGIMDGTNTDGVPNIGVKVNYDGRAYEDQFVVVTGVISCFKDTSGNLRRLIRVRGEQDIQAGAVTAPVFDPDGGTFVGSVLVTITCDTVGASIRYTVDGTEPGETNGIDYTEPVLVDTSLTLKAIALKSGFKASAVKTADYTILPDSSIAEIKAADEEALVGCLGAIVSARFDDCFYIEDDDRTFGIRVEKSDHGLGDGVRACVTGNVTTNANGERCIVNVTVLPGGTGSVDPIGIPNHALGGGDWTLGSVIGQRGVLGGVGVNNIGLLVKTTGRVIAPITATSFYLDDGSGVNLKVDGATAAEGAYVAVTGVSSCEMPGPGDDLFRVLRVQIQDDVQVLQTP